MRIKNEGNLVEGIFGRLQNFRQLLQRARHEQLEVGQLGADCDDFGQLVIESRVETKLEGGDTSRPRTVSPVRTSCVVVFNARVQVLEVRHLLEKQKFLLSPSRL